MQNFLFVLFLVSSSASFASPSDWSYITGLSFDMGGTYDLMSDPVPATPTLADRFLILMPRMCGGVNISTFTLHAQDGHPVTGTFDKEVSNENQIEWSYKLDRTVGISSIGLVLTVNNGCSIAFYVAKGTPTPTPIPVPDPVGQPELRHCKKVAFDLGYDYEGHLEATAVEGTPCFVKVVFPSLPDYRFFLDDRRAKGKSPDEEILEPEHVKVELAPQVGTPPST